jgi:hypothetical protein
MHSRITNSRLKASVFLIFSGTCLFAGPKPVIKSAEPLYSSTAHQIAITGTGFGTTQPTVTISGTPAQVLAFTDTAVSVLIPAIIDSTPGSYVLTLGAGNSDSSIDVALGTIGPAGATGPQGSAGPQGSNGAAGPQGATGPQGTAGVAGAQGNAGPAGVAGMTGPQGPTGAQGRREYRPCSALIRRRRSPGKAVYALWGTSHLAPE